MALFLAGTRQKIDDAVDDIGVLADRAAVAIDDLSGTTRLAVAAFLMACAALLIAGIALLAASHGA